MASKHGIDAFFGRNTGIWGTPVWSEIEIVADLTPGGGWEAAEIRTRESRVVLGAKVMIDIGFAARVRCDDADAGYTALMAAWRSLTADMDLLVLDGPTTTVGSFGFRGHFQVVSGGQPQPVNDILYREFEFRPYPHATERPQYAEVTTGPVLTFTNI